jgi:hypothetical protein
MTTSNFQKISTEELIKTQSKLRVALADYRKELKYYKLTGVLPLAVEWEEEKKAVKFYEESIQKFEIKCNLIKIEIENRK